MKIKKYSVTTIALLFLFFVDITASISRDRDWNFTSVAVSSTPTRITNTQSGILIIQPVGDEIYIAFNSTANANVYDFVISNKQTFTTDGHTIGASVSFGDYWTAYCATTATANWVILD